MTEPKDVLDLTERYNRPWMSGALNYKNNPRSRSGKEEFRTKWFNDLNAVDWTTPFFRHVDGKDHTHFFLDIDVQVVGKKTKRAYARYPDRLRALKIEAVIEFFRGWVAEHAQHKFFWKISGTGLHGIQRIDRKIDRTRLVPLVLSLFPPMSRVEIEFSPPKNAIHVKPLREGINARPNQDDDGWCLDYDEKNKRYIQESWVKLWVYKNVLFKFIVDLRFFHNETRIVRWTYSPYFNVPGRIYYSVPITRWDAKTVLRESVLEGIRVNKYTIPDFSFKDMIDWEDTVDDTLWIRRSAKKAGQPKAITPAYQINLYSPEDEIPHSLNKRMDEMNSLFTGPVNSTPPCMYQHHKRACSKGGSHWPRFQVGRYLRAFSYSIQDIANWYRFRINDEDDNVAENRHKLLQYLPAVLGDEKDPHKVASCSVLQDPGSVFYCCDEAMQQLCSRRHPLSRYKPQNARTPIASVKIPRQFKGKNESAYWTKIKNLIRDAFGLQRNLVVWKATRAGVTTSMIRIATEMSKKLLVVVPTNKIGEVTFPEAMRIVKNDTGETVNGAILASNRRGCLLLNFVEHGLEEMKKQAPDWGDPGVAWTKLRYHSRPDCQSCLHNHATVSTPITDNEGNPQPLNRSAITNFNRKLGFCAYTTFREQLGDFDVVFVTYAKLYSLMLGISADSEDLREDLFNYFDIILLDEISTFANRSPLDITVLKNATPIVRMNDIARIDIFALLRAEIDMLADHTTTQVSHQMIEWCLQFIAAFEYLKLKEWEKGPYIGLVQESDDAEMDVIRHPLTYYQRQTLREDFHKVHAVLDQFSRVENKALHVMENILLLMMEDSWVAMNTPTPTRAVELRFVSAPKTAEVKAFVRQFASPNNEKLVFATDACMPEVNLSEFFDIDFEDFIVGDPRKTNDQQLIIADTRQIGMIRFSIPMNCTEGKCPYFIHYKCTLEHNFVGHNPKNNFKLEKRILKAYYNDRCYRYQIEFLKECNAIARMYGPENVMIVLPNKDIYFWFLSRIKMGTVPRGVDVTYYRSDKTLGVPCDRRIMICLSMPYTPTGSHLWLAHYYHQDNLLQNYSMEDLSKTLRLNSCKQAFWQTIGRAKSPVGKTRSIVITWGVSEKGIRTLFDFHKDRMKDALPKVFLPPKRGHSGRTTYQVGRFWRTYGTTPDPALLRLSQLVRSAKWIGKWVKHSEIKRHGSIMQEEIDRLATLYDEEMFGHMGIEVELGTWGVHTTITAKSITSED